MQKRSISIRVSEDIYKIIEEEAKTNYRSMNAEVNSILSSKLREIKSIQSGNTQIDPEAFQE